MFSLHQMRNRNKQLKKAQKEFQFSRLHKKADDQFQNNKINPKHVVDNEKEKEMKLQQLIDSSRLRRFKWIEKVKSSKKLQSLLDINKYKAQERNGQNRYNHRLKYRYKNNNSMMSGEEPKYKSKLLLRSPESTTNKRARHNLSCSFNENESKYFSVIEADQEVCREESSAKMLPKRGLTVIPHLHSPCMSPISMNSPTPVSMRHAHSSLQNEFGGLIESSFSKMPVIAEDKANEQDADSSQGEENPQNYYEFTKGSLPSLVNTQSKAKDSVRYRTLEISDTIRKGFKCLQPKPKGMVYDSYKLQTRKKLVKKLKTLDNTQVKSKEVLSNSELKLRIQKCKIEHMLDHVNKNKLYLKSMYDYNMSDRPVHKNV